MAPRPKFGNVVVHVVNRATPGQLLFRDFGEYLAYQRLLARALKEVPIRLLAYCLMPNHWHYLFWPTTDRQLPEFMQWLSGTHARQLRRWRDNEGRGAVYQSRYDPSAVDTETYFYRAARYVERNPVRAGLVARAEDWLWSSASPTRAIHGIELAEWPLPRFHEWLAFVNDVEPEADLRYVRRRSRRRQRIGPPGKAPAKLAHPPLECVAAAEED